MPAIEPQVRATMLAGLAELLDQRSVRLADLMKEVGLDPDQTPDPAASISLNSYSNLLQLAAKTTGDDCFGLHFAQVFPRGGTRALGFLILNAPNLGTCLDYLVRYVRLQAEGIEFQLTDDGGVARFACIWRPQFSASRKQLMEFVMSLIVLRLSSEFGNGWLPLKAEFEYHEPRCGGEYELLFGRNLKFDQPETAITVRSDLLKSRSPFADEKLFALLKDIADSEIAHLDRSDDLIWHLDEFILKHLPQRSASLDGAATALGRTARQLQGDLKKHGTTYDEQLAKTRRALAERYLRDTDLPLTEIALMLGFSELSAFTRAARNWLGMPPSAWRQKMRSGTG